MMQDCWAAGARARNQQRLSGGFLDDARGGLRILEERCLRGARHRLECFEYRSCSTLDLASLLSLQLGHDGWNIVICSDAIDNERKSKQTTRLEGDWTGGPI